MLLIMLIKRRKNLLFTSWTSFEQTTIPFTKGCFVPNLVEMFKFCQCIFAISQLSPLGKGQGPSFEEKKLESSSPNDSLCEVWLKLAQWFLRRRIFNSSMYFRYFVIISPWKSAGPFIWTNLNPLHTRML